MKPKELNGPSLPIAAAHIWQWFLELCSGRTGNGMGPNPISWSEIHAWKNLLGLEVRAEEVVLLRALDQAYLHELNSVR